MIIGVTGYFAAGKDTVAEYLQEKDFSHYSLSDELRGVLRERGMDITRDNLVTVGNELRTKFGPGYLAQKVLKKTQQPAVITSIRSPGEVETLRQQKNFRLLFVDAPIKVRYERIIKRQREEDINLSYETFQTQEEREKSSDPNKQQLVTVAKMADYQVINDGSLEELKAKIDAIIQEVKNAEKK